MPDPTPADRPAEELAATIETVLRESLPVWWQTPPRLDWAALAVARQLLGTTVCPECGTSGACNGGPCPLTPAALPAPADRAGLVREQEAGHEGLMKATVELITSIGRARHTLATQVLGWTEPGEDYSLDQIVDHVVAEDRADQSTIRRLTAGQCLDFRAMCEKHHLPPVDGCPYPRCRAARATGRAATA
ncbi:hypothetical protein SSPNP10_15860 [Streptomyces sp. NP10]|nr:hypothetical protein SSPNP10_15860 [Streptomyces sp. NP10]